MEKISVIITSYNNDELTIAHVKQCMKSTPHEIIVVNDGGDPSLKEKIEKIPRKCNVIYARINEDILWNYHGACNLGVWLSTGDYLMFEDNDNMPTERTYQEMLEVFKDPKIGRVVGTKRMEIEMEDLDKEWTQKGSRGPNQGTSMIRREVYLKLKGQDERFCGQYGWMFYDWKSRLLKVTEFGHKGTFWYVRDAQSKLDRAMSKKNFRLYRENAHNNTIQPPYPIINFTYEIEYYNNSV